MFQKLCISEADRLCKAYTDAWTFARNNWYPSSFHLDWSGLPKDWPCSHLTDDEWSTLLNASANRMRNTGFILAVIRCLPESIQNTWRALLNFCVTTGMTAKSIKTYIRIAIPKKMDRQPRTMSRERAITNIPSEGPASFQALEERPGASLGSPRYGNTNPDLKSI